MTLRRAVISLIMSCAFIGSAEAKIVADCGAAVGKVYFAHPDHNRWEDDAITGGRVLIDSLPGGDVNVIFRYAGRRTISAKDDGGMPVVVTQNPDWSEFTVLVAYPSFGTIETYMLTRKGGEKLLLWTTLRPAAGPVPPKVSAYTSRCE